MAEVVPGRLLEGRMAALGVELGQQALAPGSCDSRSGRSSDDPAGPRINDS